MIDADVRALIEAISGGAGSVSSVGLSMPAVFSVSGSPVTTSGTLAVSLASQTANKVWAGPTSGGSASPTFRTLVAADLPYTFAENETPSGTQNGVNTVFTLAHAPITGTLRLFKQGLRMMEGADFTLSGSTITMINIPVSGQNFIADYRY